MWIFIDKDQKQRELTDEDIIGYFGFVYIITNNINNKRYIGKKLFTKVKYNTKKGKRKKSRTESNWKEYWGSSDYLLEDIKKLGEENFSRHVIMLCKTRGDCNYYEAKMQFLFQVLEFPDKFYNNQIRIRATTNHLSCNKKVKS